MKRELIEKIIENYLLQLEENLIKIENNNTLLSENIGKYVILRGYDTGVHFGKLVYASKLLYRLENSRRLWRWWTKKGIGLTALATYGLAEREEVKICTTIPKIEITDKRISEIIPCTEEAIDSIKNYPEANV